jgi:hypothetical protein
MMTSLCHIIVISPVQVAAEDVPEVSLKHNVVAVPTCILLKVSLLKVNHWVPLHQSIR